MLTALIIHQVSVILSILGFFARGIGHIFEKPWVKLKPVKILPHIIDTALLVSALVLLIIGPWSINEGWIQIKILGLVLYIVLGLMAFRFAKNRIQKAIYWLLALVVIFYVVAVAKTHLAIPFM
ncbi:SirB family protein [Thiosulfatimonas sediminis]|uniref:SirB family protein n=1 Tax=Thiosulfatimonas sediminis TaxID=2675054 RepID=A0A6F8PUI8_9GAMM|nr:SirB2 family protein [Thiosulfatimonas sediminis]BBP45803.1 SirB family protein [Thiosulfatimonas sediminis]